MHCSRVDAFRHRAAAIIADRATAGHVYPWLTLIGAAVIASQRVGAQRRPMIAKQSRSRGRKTGLLRRKGSSQ
jgi:hypothetical protein